MKTKIIKSILAPALGVLSTATVTPIVMSSCGEQANVSVEGISFEQQILALVDVGQTQQLTPIFVPENATNKNVIWSSSDENIAIVSQTGLVKAVAAGDATITATTDEGGFKATCKVNVSIQVKSITLNKVELGLVKNKTEQLIAIIFPETATNKEVTWSTANSRIATVDSTGLVTAVNSGETTITAKTVDGKKATCQVKVTSPVTGVELDRQTLTLNLNNTDQLTATVLPKDATNKKVTWKSSAATIVDVDQTGKVTGLAVGSAIITVTTEDGSFKASCTITVKE